MDSIFDLMDDHSFPMPRSLSDEMDLFDGLPEAFGHDQPAQHLMSCLSIVRVVRLLADDAERICGPDLEAVSSALRSAEAHALMAHQLTCGEFSRSETPYAEWLAEQKKNAGKSGTGPQDRRRYRRPIRPTGSAPSPRKPGGDDV